MSGAPIHSQPPSGVGKHPIAKKRKSLYLIRHAESEENRRLASLQKVLRCVLGLSWPQSSDVKAALELMDVSGQVDSPVSSKGKLQISDVRTQLACNNFLQSNGVELILHSPLQRAWETCMGLFPPESIAEGQLLSSSRGGSACKMEETDLLLEKTPTEWIFTSTFHDRIRLFAEFVEQRPESTVVAVGHSQFFRAMLGVNFKFHNCDVWHVELALPSSSSQPLSPSPLAPPCPSPEAKAGACGPQEVEREVEEEDATGHDGMDCGFETRHPWSNLRQVLVCSRSLESNGNELNGGPVDDEDDVNPISTSKKDKNA